MLLVFQMFSHVIKNLCLVSNKVGMTSLVSNKVGMILVHHILTISWCSFQHKMNISASSLVN